MKCVACQTDNKDDAKVCRKCGLDLKPPSLWRPTWGWHLRVLGVIYGILIVAYFCISYFLGKVVPEPYRMRTIPKEVTPWLQK